MTTYESSEQAFFENIRKKLIPCYPCGNIPTILDEYIEQERPSVSDRANSDLIIKCEKCKIEIRHRSALKIIKKWNELNKGGKNEDTRFDK